MKTTYTIEIIHDEELHLASVREHVQSAINSSINSYRGGLHITDPRRSIHCSKINKAKGETK